MNNYAILIYTLLFVAVMIVVIVIGLKKRLKSGQVAPVDPKKLMDPTKKQAQIILIKCEKCQYEGKPVKWNSYYFFSIGFLFTILNIIGVLIYFIFVNSYICPKCKERNKLVKILNDRREQRIGGLSKHAFLTICVPLLILGIFLALSGNLAKYQ